MRTNKFFTSGPVIISNLFGQPTSTVECPICLEDTGRYISMMCHSESGVAHHLCIPCFREHFGSGSETCPQCRAFYTPESIRWMYETNLINPYSNNYFVADDDPSDFTKEERLARGIIKSILSTGTPRFSVRDIKRMNRYNLRDMYEYFDDYLFQRELSTTHKKKRSYRILCEYAEELFDNHCDALVV